MPSRSNPRARALLAGLAAALALAACTAQDAARGDGGVASAEPPASAPPLPAAGGVTRRGDSFAMMSEQYVPRAGPFAATGASAWVRPSPAPAFVASGPPPPADPPAPPPAAVANRQPGGPAAAPAPASDVARPEAAAPEAASAPSRDPAVRTAGLALFNGYSCGTCHIFADAGANGAVGPSLDRNLVVRAIVDVVTDGQGAMPSFGGQMSDSEILTLANYLNQYSR